MSRAQPESRSLNLREIGMDPSRFQYRRGGIDEVHVKELTQALTITQKPFDPIWVWIDPISDEPLVVSGHHRVSAYRAAKWTRKVPAKVFRCEEHEALLLAAEGNRKQHLPITREDRNNTAWILTCNGSNSRRQITNATTVSDGTISNMRRTMKALLKAGIEPPSSWWKAMQAAKGISGQIMTDDERQTWLEAKTAELDAKFGEDLGVAMHRYPEATMEVIAKRLGETRCELFAEYYSEGWSPYKHSLDDVVPLDETLVDEDCDGDRAAF